MTWFRVDDSFSSHPKVRSIPRSQRRLAKETWLSCGTWSARHLTDGIIPRDVVEDEGGEQEDAAALVAAGLWHTDGHDCERCVQPPAGGYVFHDWADYQPTREKVHADRRATAERVAKYRAGKNAARNATSNPSSNAPHNGVGNGVTSGVVTPPPARPDPTRPDPNISTTKPLVAAAASTRDQGTLAVEVEIVEPPPPNPIPVLTAAYVDAYRAGGGIPTTAVIRAAGKNIKRLVEVDQIEPPVLLVAVQRAATARSKDLDRYLGDAQQRYGQSQSRDAMRAHWYERAAQLDARNSA